MKKNSGSTIKKELWVSSPVLSFTLLFVFGCANYATRIREPRYFLEMGHYEAAIEDLQTLVDRKDNDELLYLMDLGIAYHAAGNYEEAVKIFLRAEQWADIKDYTSLSQEVGSVILNDEVKTYKGENFEKLLINVYLAIDYTLMKKWDEALVECRKVNHKLDLMISQGGLPYERNAFAKYLAAVLFEARKEYNDAFVDYRQLKKWGSDFVGVGLLRMADKLKAEQELATYKKEYPAAQYKMGKNQGEIVVIVEQGKVPVKVPLEGFRLLPRFKKRYFTSQSVILRDEVGTFHTPSYPLFDIEATAIRDLDHRIGAILAKKVGGMVAKEIIAHQVAKQTKNEALGLLTSLALHMTDSADLRSWSTLPARLHIARQSVPAGRQDVVLDMVTMNGQVIAGIKRFSNVEVKSGEIVFLHHRMIE